MNMYKQMGNGKEYSALNVHTAMLIKSLELLEIITDRVNAKKDPENTRINWADVGDAQRLLRDLETIKAYCTERKAGE